MKKLAHKCAKCNNIQIRQREENQIADEGWLLMSRKKHTDILLKKSETTSLFRVTAFNKTTVAELFSNYKNILELYTFFLNLI